MKRAMWLAVLSVLVVAGSAFADGLVGSTGGRSDGVGTMGGGGRSGLMGSGG